MPQDAIVITFLDKARRLRFDVNAIADLEERYGDKSILELIARPALPVRVVRDLLWAGLKHEDRTLTPTKVGEILQDFIDKNDTTAPVKDALEQALIKAGMLPKPAKEDGTGEGNGGAGTPAPSA